MQLTPVYGDDPIIEVGAFLGDVGVPLVRQRARLAELLAGLADEQWAADTRCEGWSVQDVIAHLVTVNGFWGYSIAMGLAGKPSQALAQFDPVASPAQMVAAVRSKTSEETLAEFVASNEALAAAIGGLDTEGWSTLAEAPPGHLSIRCLALHGLWDSWIHERDIAVPLGLPTVEEADEIAGALAYVVALGPAFTASLDRAGARVGALEVVGTDPDVRVVVDVGPRVSVHDGEVPDGTVTITGDAVELVESLSFRAPFTARIADEDRWLLGDLGTVFDRPS